MDLDVLVGNRGQAISLGAKDYCQTIQKLQVPNTTIEYDKT